MKMEEKDIDMVVELENTPLSSVAAVVAVSVSRKDRYTVKWALEKFSSEQGIILFNLLHVRPVITRIPTPMGNFLPIVQVREDVADAFRKEVEWKVNESLLPCKKLCAQRRVHVQVVQIESDDIVSGIAGYVCKQGIKNLVIGSSSQSMFSRNRMLASKISEGCPKYCTVYVVSKGSLSSLRPSDLETNGSSSNDDSSPESLCSRLHTCSTESFSSLQPALLQLQQFQALSALHQALLHQSVPSSESWESTYSSLIHEGSNVVGLNHRWPDASKYTDDSSSFGAFISATRQVNVDVEIEKLRVKLRHMREMYVAAQGEASDTSRKLNELLRRRMDEEANLRKICCKEEEAKELAREEMKRYEAAKRDAENVKHCLETEARERKEAQRIALREMKEKQRLKSALKDGSPRFYNFTWQEILSATSSFCNDLKIGMGSYGTVYKCNFHHTTAAVKVYSDVATEQFQLELEILSQIQHPNLLILLGASPDHGCLVYEFMENGSLEERLKRKNNTPPLPWFDRFRIAWEVASALLFLHHSKPRAIIHRDLKPANILLDHNNVSKIGDFGLSVMISEDLSSSVTINDAAPVGTLCYIDPEYQRTGVISPKSDVYALGMVILQMLTVKPAIALAHAVEIAIENDCLKEVLDQEAGSWPFQETKEMAALALKCIELRQVDRPDLQGEVLPFLEKMRDLAEKYRDVALSTTTQPPSHFICPMLKEIMTDPCVAADGYTYDRKAIEQWLEKNDTSPTTKESLPHRDLIPNYALLSAIMEWNSGKRS